MKQHAPATARNSGPIAQMLENELLGAASVLEIASGSGEHGVFFTRHFPQILWQPSDLDAGAIASIAAWTKTCEHQRILPPVVLDMMDAAWPDTLNHRQYDAIFCANMIHISPWAAACGLFAGAGQLLRAQDKQDRQGKLILYGPFIDDQVETAPSNLSFDSDLKRRNPQWGLRNIADCNREAADNGLEPCACYTMPANNLAVVYRKR